MLEWHGFGDCLFLGCFCRVTIDCRGVRSRILGSKRYSGEIRWENVHSVGVFRTFGGERLIFVSTIPKVWKGRNMMANDLPLDMLIKMGYSRRRISIIRRYYKGKIVKV